MQKKELENLFLEYIQHRVEDLSYDDIDCFAEDAELSDDDVNYCLDLPLAVRINR